MSWSSLAPLWSNAQWWSNGRSCAPARSDLSGVTDVAVRSNPSFSRDEKPRWKQRGFLLGALTRQARKEKGREMSRPFGSYQLRKQRRPYGPECQPGGQLYIGRQPPKGPRCQPGPQPPATGMAAVSVAAAWSSGATGMAFEADIDAR